MPIISKLFNQPWLKLYMEKCGYKNISTGICLGLAHMSIQALSLGELDAFIDTLQLINNLFYNKLHNCNLTKQEQTAITILLDGISLYHHEDTKLAFNLYNIYSLSGCYKLNLLDSFLKTLEDTISDFIKSDLINTKLNNQIYFILQSNNHAVALGYNYRNNNKWTIVDSTLLFMPNGLNIISSSYCKEQLIPLLYTAFTGKKINDYNQKIALFTKIFVTHQAHNHCSIAPVKKLFKYILNKHKHWKNLHEIKSTKLNNTIVGGSWLYVAAANGDSKKVQQLIQANTDVNSTSCDNISALWVAAKNGHTKVVNLLINANANIDNPDNDGSSPLWIAAQNGHFKIVELLINANANVNMPHQSGATPVYIATQNNHTKIVDLLIKANANINLPTTYGITPLCLAKQRNNHNLLLKLTAETIG
ncbi:MAG: ankyrin repeat domain-containing protein [Gammaproteobacteria bacterium]